jgi:predicted dehydrogenase
VGGRAKRSAWRAFKSQAGGGILIMNAVHNLDAMYYATGLKPVEVAAMGGTYTAKAAVEDTISILVKYHKNNAYGTCDAMSGAHGASHTDNSTVIYGTKGTIRLGDKLELFTSIEGEEYPAQKYTEIELDEYNSRATIMDDFAMAILEDRQPTVTGEDGLMITDLILSSYRSLQSGQVEKLATKDIWL